MDEDEGQRSLHAVEHAQYSRNRQELEGERSNKSLDDD